MDGNQGVALPQHHLATMATKITTSSAMNPALMLCLIVCPLAIIAASSLFHFGYVIPAAVFILILIAPLAIACWQLIYFTKKAPDRLQGERHLEKMLEIRHSVGVKDAGTIVEYAVGSTLSANPQIEDMKVNSFILSYRPFTQLVSEAQVLSHVQYNQFVEQYYQPFAGTYIIKSSQTLSVLNQSFRGFFDANVYMLTQIQAANSSGLLPQDIWNWMNLGSFPSVPPVPVPAALGSGAGLGSLLAALGNTNGLQSK